MTPLRKRMIQQMTQRGFSVRTHNSYLYAVEKLARYYGESPDRLSLEQLQQFFDYLAQEKKLSAASCRLYLNGVRFLYLRVLEWQHFDVKLIVPKKPQRIPELLTCKEVDLLISMPKNLKHRTLLLVCYGCGLRVSELVNIKLRHVDGERKLLRVEQGKGGKDRTVIVSDALIRVLRDYWRLYHPTRWLFPSQDPLCALNIQTAQRVFKAAKNKSGIQKVGGIHSLRHAYATHQLQAGMPIYQLQQMLGHGDIKSTLRYIHWVHDYKESRKSAIDLVSRLDKLR